MRGAWLTLGRTMYASMPEPLPIPPGVLVSSIQLAGQRVVFAFAGTEIPGNLRKRITARRNYRAFERAIAKAERYGGAGDLYAMYRRL